MNEVRRYDKDKTHKKVECPDVIKKYNGQMGGIDNSDMFTHLYKTPMRIKWYYMRLYGYILDLSECNLWVLYKRDCNALDVTPTPLKTFRLEISISVRSRKNNAVRGIQGVPVKARNTSF